MIPHRMRRLLGATTAALLGAALLVAPGTASASAATTVSGHKEIAAVQGEVIRSGPNWQKTYVWPTDQHAGDCTLYGGASLVLSSDGKAQWHAFVSTSHTFSGDIWHATFQLKDRNGFPLGELRSDSPTMYVWFWRYRWEDSWGNRVMFSPAILSLVHSVAIYSSC
ncbi:hypothetical protein GCM10010174_34740 [Kutzneria viridogrisea]|uniref:DUF6294 domain-containing protein n=2 Tax=Kutzneria TaxID=43356 RepID=A0ABR6BMA3_9PSEU|nr:DUF6294 family protein [Kutzneria albida]AHH94961.1 putative secreted protein [Kutzneria albida DSM 43870]MBA8927684.1 hypothetical protein [Kutzneria viridogrisea]